MKKKEQMVHLLGQLSFPVQGVFLPVLYKGSEDWPV